MERKSKVKPFFLSITAVLLCCLMLLESTAAELFSAEHYHYDVRKDLSLYFSNADDVIAAVRRCLKRNDWHILIEFNAVSDGMDDIDDIVRELMYYAVSETEYPDEGDYIRYRYGGYELNYSHTLQGDKYFYSLEIIPYYYTTPEQEQAVSDEVSRIIDSFGFDKTTTDYEKFCRIYDYIYNTVSYDKVHKDNAGNHMKTTAYSALFYHTAVCQGYSSLMYRMLRESGVDARVITGKALYPDKDEYHAWNIVCIDGSYYNVDITWDKQCGERKYFLKSDGDFGDHLRDSEYTSEEFRRNYPMAALSYL